MLLNAKTEVLSVMENAGLLGILGDIIVNGTDPLLLVCHSLFLHGRLVICLFE